MKLGLPDVGGELEHFKTELSAIRELLEKLLELEKGKQ